MIKQWILLLFMLPMTAAFAQHDLKIDLGYSRMMHKDCLWEYSKGIKTKNTKTHFKNAEN